MNLVVRGLSQVIKKRKTPLKIVEQKYGKGPTVRSEKPIITYLQGQGFSSLGKLIKAK